MLESYSRGGCVKKEVVSKESWTVCDVTTVPVYPGWKVDMGL